MGYLATRRSHWGVLAALIAAFWMGACGPAAPAAGPTEAKSIPAPGATLSPPTQIAPPAPVGGRATVRVGGSGGLIDRALFVGLEKGFYDEQGLDLDIQIFSTAVDMIAPLATGHLDVMHGGSYPGFFNAAATGVDLKIVSNVSLFRQPGPGVKNSNWLVIRKDLAEQVRSVADLRGRKVAIHTRGSTAEQLLERTLAYHGLSLGDVQIEAVSFGDQVAALSNGAVDAAMAIEPFITLTEGRGIAVPLFEVANAMPRYTVQWLYYGPDFVKSRPEVGRRFLVAYLKSLRFIEDAWRKGTNREEVVQLFIKNTPMKDARLYDRMGVTYGETNGTINVEALAADQDFFAQQGTVKQRLDLNRIIDTSFGQYALQVLGPYQD